MENFTKWREKGISDTDNLEDITTETDDDLKKTFYPDETVSGTDMQSATFIEQHVASLTICKSFFYANLITFFFTDSFF